MFDRDIWQEIFHSIRSNKLRTFLTGFSVAWGIFILVLLLASVNGMQNGFYDQFNDNASNAVYIHSRTTSKAYAGFEKGRRIQFTNDDVDYIKGSFKGDFEFITPVFERSTSARYKEETGSYRVMAINNEHIFIQKVNISQGRYINKSDVVGGAKVAVIGKKVATDLYKKEDPLGKFIEINGLPFMIVGVFTDDKDEGAESMIYAPITTYQRIYSNTSDIDQIMLTYNPDFNLDEAMDFSNKITVLLKRRHKISPDDQAGLRIWNTAEAFNDIGQFTGILQIMSVVIGLLILIAGIVGIGNIMVFIIKERTKEIGIRKALGAKPKQIIMLVLLESVFITALSGLIGLLFATGLLSLVGPLMDAPAFKDPSVDMSTIIIATIVLVVAGMLAGLIPAIKAARVKPIVALSDK
ncbi:ABC transporter permease [Aurantibacter crassamenti]|uniref:ABC transporter permease n=1 Tax=Aurantibacter crassamenti TaxID=1837375 RepID=UPI001939F8E2|nr:ABC transporter permease [Aurantibacter crassamenti]MBM1106007.1 ABC transporter permease [Aurantibacter crassamenti]